MIRVATPTRTLFWKYVPNSRSVHTFSKWSKVIGQGTSEVDPVGRNAKSRIQ